MNKRTLIETLRPWGKARIIKPLTGGYRNLAWLIEQEGECRVAKTTRRSESAVTWLSSVHDAAEAAGFAVPRLIPNQQTTYIVNGLTVESYIEGTAPSPKDWQRLGQHLEQFHQATQHIAQRPTFASSVNLLDQAAGGDVDLSAMPSEIVQRCREAWRLFANAPQSVIHGDLNSSNILITPSGQIALIDWDESRVDASIFDRLALAQQSGYASHNSSEAEQYALLAWEIAVCWHTEPDYAQRLEEELMDSHLAGCNSIGIS